jgi:glycosyltransferase involved in cell wall biosynthesis
VSSVCLVVPCFNEASRLDVVAFERFTWTAAETCLCFVNDGSTDRTFEVLQALARQGRPDAVRVESLPRNAGKAEAVRQGMLRSHAWRPFRYIGYWDADLATPLDELDTMRRVAERDPDCLIVLGSRVRRLGASVKRRPARHYLGRIFATAASLTLHMPVYDTQCGAKLFRASFVPALFADPFLSRWFFDVEILARARNQLGLTHAIERTIEVPLGSWYDVAGSRLSFGSLMRAPVELWAISRRYNRDVR